MMLLIAILAIADPEPVTTTYPAGDGCNTITCYGKNVCTMTLLACIEPEDVPTTAK